MKSFANIHNASGYRSTETEEPIWTGGNYIPCFKSDGKAGAGKQMLWSI